MATQVLGAHVGYPPDFDRSSQPIMAAEAVTKPRSATSAPSTIKEEATPDTARGRRRTRESLNGNEEEDDSGEEEGASGTGSSRKRRRSRKGLDKKFECPHEGCRKSYSRAEHLYRHQLNRELPTYIGQRH